MTVCDSSDEEELDRAILSDDDLRDLCLRPLAQVREVVVLSSIINATELSFRLG